MTTTMPEERKTDTPKRRTTENSNDHEHDSSNLLHPYYFGILFLNRLTKTTMPEERKTDTPETDAAEDQQEEASEYRGHLVRADFARKLERERDEARKEVAKWKKRVVSLLPILVSLYGKKLNSRLYNMFKEAGARMDDFKRSDLKGGEE